MNETRDIAAMHIKRFDDSYLYIALFAKRSAGGFGVAGPCIDLLPDTMKAWPERPRVGGRRREGDAGLRRQFSVAFSENGREGSTTNMISSRNSSSPVL